MEVVDAMGQLVSMSLDNYKEGDYIDSDGYLVCGHCHTRKQKDVALFGQTVRVGVVCKCREKKLAEEQAEEERREFDRKIDKLRNLGITDRAYQQYTFDRDDGSNPQTTEICKRYVEKWEEMFANNIGILFYGGVGTGKTFCACCIANALIDRRITASVTNFPRLINRIQSTFDGKQEIIDSLQQFKLLVIDDLGVERDTSYSTEQVFNVIDTRARSGMPLIVTTNLSMKDLENPQTLAHKRIYDRVKEMCPIKLKIDGASRRAEKAAEKKDRARKVLGIG